MQIYSIGQELEQHALFNRWINFITGIEELQLNADPLAKACLPIYYTTYEDSPTYRDTFKTGIRFIYNTIFRLPDIFTLSFEI